MTPDGLFRLSVRHPDYSLQMRGRDFEAERFEDARRLALIIADVRRGAVVFVEQYGKHVWASDGRTCPAAPEEF
jgi:hypothetical protein